MRLKLAAAAAAALLLSTAGPASAWTQINNGGGTTADCHTAGYGGCFRILANVPHLARTSPSTWDSSWDNSLSIAFRGWNNLRPPHFNPVWSMTTQNNESLYFGRGPLPAGICAVTRPSYPSGTGQGGEVAYATITLNSNEYHSLHYENSSTCYITYDLAHEIGHGGQMLSHSRVPDNLMVQGAYDRVSPGPDDANGISAIYG